MIERPKAKWSVENFEGVGPMIVTASWSIPEAKSPLIYFYEPDGEIDVATLSGRRAVRDMAYASFDRMSAYFAEAA